MVNETNICPVCEEGQLHESHYEGDFKHNGKTLHVVDLECYHCEECGADPVFEDQIRRNHRKVADAKRRDDGLLLGHEVRAIREHLHLSQSEAADLFGGGANAFSKYERGDVLQSKPMDRLLRIAARYPFLINSLREECGLEPVAGYNQEVAGYMDETPISLELRGGVSASDIRNGEVVDITEWQRNAA
jgi:HTH-type transcriptional regulator/antitoxin MqsA